MLGFISRKLTRRILAAFLTAAIVPIVIAGYVAYRSTSSALEASESEKLVTERDLRKRQVRDYLRETVQTLGFMSGTPTVVSAIETLHNYHQYGESEGKGSFNVSTDMYQAICEKVDPFCESFLATHNADRYGFHDILIISAGDGNVMYTAKKGKELGTNLQTGPLKDSGLARLWKRVVKQGRSCLVDFRNYQPIESRAAFAGVPIVSKAGTIVGVLALRLGPEHLDKIFGSDTEMAAKAATYLFGQDSVLRSQSLFQKETGFLGSTDFAESADQSSAKESGLLITNDKRGEERLVAYAGLGLESDPLLNAEFDWTAVAEVRVADAFKPVETVRTRLLIIGFLTGLSVIAVALGTARGIARPVLAMAESANSVTDGDLSAEIKEMNRDDELGALSKAFRVMIDSLREQIRRMGEGIDVLGSASDHIARSVSEAASGTQKISSAVSQTTTTVEQVKQAAQSSSELAKTVVNQSKEAVEVSNAGTSATQDTVGVMNQIEERMDSIGETVVRLSEQSRAIEDIIAAVQDIAEQSNLLAVNASIEAARAGDQGKGFAIVAEEIKSLADQSREATAKVGEILNDTRRSVSAVVMAAEEGAKIVGVGVEQSKRAGKSIAALSESVVLASEEAAVIESSSQEQLTGVSQVSYAMSDIESAMRGTLEATTELEFSAEQLKTMGGVLKDLIEKYRI